MDQEAATLDLREIALILKKHIALIIIIPIIFAILGYLVSSFIIAPKYEADATLVVNAGQNSQTSVVTYDQLNTAQQLVNSCAVILKSDNVLDKVISNLNLDMTAEELANEVTVSPVNQTEVLDISVKDENAQRAVYIANEISKIAPDILIKTVKAGSVEVVSSAKADNKPVSPNVMLFTAVGFIIGIFAVVILSFIIEKMDNTFSSEDDIQKHLGFTVLGVIPNLSAK